MINLVSLETVQGATTPSRMQWHGQTFPSPAIMAHESPNPWTTSLPAVLLGIRSAVKETLGRLAAEMIYGKTLRLPGDFTENSTVDANTDLENYSDNLRVAMSRPWLSPPRDTQQKDMFQYKELET